MRVISQISAALFTVPLYLSSLLLRAHKATRKAPKRSSRSPGKRAEATGASPAPKGSVPSPRARTADVRAMRRALTAVLDAHAGSREVFRYLSHFERRFAKSGLHTLETMPVDRLRRALAQFEAIVTNWSPPKLADLRSRMAVAVTARDLGATTWKPAATISKAYKPRDMPMLGRGGGHASGQPQFQASKQVEVDDDVSISRFEAAFGEWHPSQRQALAVLDAGAPATR